MTVTGPAYSLFLTLTRRLRLADSEATGISVDGDAELAQHWLDDTARRGLSHSTVHAGVRRRSRRPRRPVAQERRAWRHEQATPDRAGDGVLRPAAHGDRGDGPAGGRPAGGARAPGADPDGGLRPGVVPRRRGQPVRAAATQRQAPRVADGVRAGPRARVHAGRGRDASAAAGAPSRDPDGGDGDVAAGGVRAAAVARAGRRAGRPDDGHRRVAARSPRGRRPARPPLVARRRHGHLRTRPPRPDAAGLLDRRRPHAGRRRVRRQPAQAPRRTPPGRGRPRPRHPPRGGRGRPAAGVAATPAAAVGAVRR